MILQELVKFYDRISQDPEQDIPMRGFIKQGVAFEIVIGADGYIEGINDLRRKDGTKLSNLIMTLPGSAKPSGSGINPTPGGWDRTDYMLGYEDPESWKDGESEKKIHRIGEFHEAFKNLYVKREKEININEYSSFCHFLKNWTPEKANKYPILKELSRQYGVVRFSGSKKYLHDILKKNDQDKPEEENTKQDDYHQRCLVTGNFTPIVRIHTIKSKGVSGAQVSGAALVSFNNDAFCSFGKVQSFNAPIGEEASFKFSTALNKLLERNSERRVVIGDTTCLFWAEIPGLSENIFRINITSLPSEDEEIVNKTRATLRGLIAGKPQEIQEEGGFYILGLSPNNSRLSVRFWYRGTVSEMMSRIICYQQELKVTGGKDENTFFTVWQLLKETGRETKDIPPMLSGALMRSILFGTLYPMSLYQIILRRIKADRILNHTRMAIIKAILIRNYNKKELYMLDEKRQEIAYHLGRLFASLEKTQKDALKNINASIKDRYYGSASSTPATVFPRLIRMSQHHIGKLDGGRKIYAEKNMQTICSSINEFPKYLNLSDQGLFALGYYHQREDYFTKKTKIMEENHE